MSREERAGDGANDQAGYGCHRVDVYQSVPPDLLHPGALPIASKYAACRLRQGDSLTSQLSTARLSRRAFLGGTLAAAAGVCFSGCGTAVSAGIAGTPLDPETVTYWNLFGGGDGARMLTMLDTYRASHPNPLEAATFTWGIRTTPRFRWPPWATRRQTWRSPT
jgi:hypothetical protein